MTSYPIQIRPASELDHDAHPDILPDRWAPTGNRRSFVAEIGDRVVGHCRGIDNAIHPHSRTLVLDVSSGGSQTDWDRVADALLTAHIQVSELPLTLKVDEDDEGRIRLAARFNAALIQLMPPWLYTVGPALRAWAGGIGGGDGRVRPARPEDIPVIAEVYAAHYVAQHASWSPAIAEPELAAEIADELGSTEGVLDRSVVLERAGSIEAQALVWPDEEAEIVLQTLGFETAAGRRDMERCLAAVIDASPDRQVYTIDAHATNEMEMAMIAGVPGGNGPWTAITSIPVGHGKPVCTRFRSIPPEASSFVARLGGGSASQDTGRE